VVIASARPPRSVRHIYKLLQLDTWQINYNGALIWDEVVQTPIFHRPLPKGVAKRIVDDARLLHEDVQVTCEILDKSYTDRYDPNDVGMLQIAGVAVAMDNAHPLVKKVAHWVAPSNNDHGVHAALVRYGLCE